MNKVTKLNEYTSDYHEQLIQLLKKKKEAKIYLQVAMEEYEEDCDAKAFMLALRNVVEAQGGVSHLAERTKLNRQNLYRVLSSRGNPRLATLGQVIHALGFKLSIA